MGRVEHIGRNIAEFTTARAAESFAAAKNAEFGGGYTWRKTGGMKARYSVFAAHDDGVR